MGEKAASGSRIAYTLNRIFAFYTKNRISGHYMNYRILAQFPLRFQRYYGIEGMAAGLRAKDRKTLLEKGDDHLLLPGPDNRGFRRNR